MSLPRIFAILAISAWVSACAGDGLDTKPSGFTDVTSTESPYEFHRALAYTLMRSGQYAAAIPHIRELLKLKKEDAEAHYMLGAVYSHMGDSVREQAREELERAIELDDTLAPAHAALGVLLNTMERHQLALASHKRAIELDPSRAEYHNNLGFGLYLLGRYYEAVAAYLEALKIDPSMRRIHNNVAFAYSKTGDLDKAFKHFRIAGPMAEARNNMGFVREERGELEEAYEEYLAAYKADPKLEPAKKNLERLARQLGKPLPDGVESKPGPVATTGEVE